MMTYFVALAILGAPLAVAILLHWILNGEWTL